MGIYDSVSLPSMDLEGVKNKAPIVGGILLLLLILGAGYFLLQAKSLSVQTDGKIDLSTNPDGLQRKPSAELHITVTNASPDAVHNVTVFIKPRDEKALLVYPDSIAIDVLDKSRTVLATVRTNPNERALSGIYEVEVTAVIAENRFTELVEIEINNPESQ